MIKVRPVMYACLLVGLLASGAKTASAQWPQFRGPNGSGVDQPRGIPSPSRHRRTSLEGRRPVRAVVAGRRRRRMYLTASDGDRLLTIAFDAATGRELWRKEIRPRADAQDLQSERSGIAQSRRRRDGVVVFFPDFGLVAYAADGKDAGRSRSVRSRASTAWPRRRSLPAIWSFLSAISRRFLRGRGRSQDRTAAMEAGTPGAIDGYATPMVFRRRRPGGARSCSDRRGSTPTRSRPASAAGGCRSARVAPWARPSPAATPCSSRRGIHRAVAAAVRDGAREARHRQGRTRVRRRSSAPRRTWRSTSVSSITTPTRSSRATEWAKMRAYGIGEYGAIAIRPGERHAASWIPRRLWRFQKNMPYIPAPLLYQNVFYMVKDGGIITALDAATGRLLKEGRSPDALGEYYASPVAADGKVFLAEPEGKITRAQGRPAMGGARGERSRRRDPRDAGAERRPHLRAHAQRASIVSAPSDRLSSRNMLTTAASLALILTALPIRPAVDAAVQACPGTTVARPVLRSR